MENVGRPVQRHYRLSDAGPAVHDESAPGVRADDDVLDRIGSSRARHAFGRFGLGQAGDERIGVVWADVGGNLVVVTDSLTQQSTIHPPTTEIAGDTSRPRVARVAAKKGSAAGVRQSNGRGVPCLIELS